MTTPASSIVTLPQKNDSTALTTAAAPAGMPHNLEAEQALLGALMIDNHSYEKVAEFLQAPHFMEPLHGLIYQTIARLIERGQLANPVTIKAYLGHDPRFNEAGGADFLSAIVANTLTVSNMLDFARAIHDAYLRRQLILIGDGVINEARRYNVDGDATTVIEHTEQKLYDLSMHGNNDGGFQPFAQALRTSISQAEAAFKREGQLSGISSGFIDLDNLLGGLHKSDLIILAGRPSMGKTALATNMAFSAARRFRTENDALGRKQAVDGAVVGFFSLEMSADQLATRIIAEQSGIGSERIRRGNMAHKELEQVIETAQHLNDVPLYIDDTPSLTVSALRTRARRLQRQQGLSMIVIDYLQLLRSSLPSRGDNRVNEISEISRSLKALAKELSVPVIALSQLSRAVEMRDDKRPQLADLRESGSIEQDADVVMFVYREQYYMERQEPSQRADEDDAKFNERYQRWRERMNEVMNMAEVIIAKQRHGPIGKVQLRFDGNSTKFDNYTPDDRVPAHR